MKVIPDSWRAVMRFLNNSIYPSQWNSVLHEVGKYSSIKPTSQFSNIQNSFVKMICFSLFLLGAVLGCGNGEFRFKGSPEGSSDQEFRSSILCDVIEISWWLISRSIENLLKMTSPNFRVGSARLRLSPRLNSKVKWIPLWTILKLINITTPFKNNPRVPKTLSWPTLCGHS